MPFKIVYLDDEPALLELFEELFGAPDVLIRTFVDADVAVEAINSDVPHLVFLDYRLSNTSGDLVAEQLDPAIPKVLMTGDLTVKTVSNFVRVFHKPFDIDEMASFISEKSTRHAQHRRL